MLSDISNPPRPSHFPADFAFGCGSSAFQTEGAAFEDGRGPSIQDMEARREGAIWGGHSFEVACDTYHRYEQDIALMGQMGLRALDTSISWSRVLPEGVGKPNPAGLDYYDRFVDALLAQGIEPWVMLYHWDMPLKLFYRGGWLNRDVADWFAEFAHLVVERLSDRVSHWLTFTEPQSVIPLGHLEGAIAPGLKLPFGESVRAMHHLLLAHGKAVQAIRAAAKQPVRIGLSPVGRTRLPLTDSPADVEAARKATFATTMKDLYGHTWVSDPIFFGAYPEDAWELFGADVPEVRDGDMATINQPIDVYGINIYSGGYVRPTADGGVERVPLPAGAKINSLEWPIHPETLYWGPKFLYERYGKPVAITENGYAGREWVSRDGAVHDFQRIDYVQTHLLQLERAIADGVDVAAYFHWTFLDAHECSEAYKDRFGLVHVDFETLERTVKDSGRWYAEVIASNGAALQQPPLELLSGSR